MTSPDPVGPAVPPERADDHQCVQYGLADLKVWWLRDGAEFTCACGTRWRYVNRPKPWGDHYYSWERVAEPADLARVVSSLGLPEDAGVDEVCASIEDLRHGDEYWERECKAWMKIAIESDGERIAVRKALRSNIPLEDRERVPAEVARLRAELAETQCAVPVCVCGHGRRHHDDGDDDDR